MKPETVREKRIAAEAYRRGYAVAMNFVLDECDRALGAVASRGTVKPKGII